MVYQFKIESQDFLFDGDSLELYQDYIPNIQDVLINPTYPVCNHKITFIVANACNAHCLYCYQQGKVFSNTSLMSKDAVDKALTYIFDNEISVDAVSFFGGEPTLNFPIIEYIVESFERKNIFPAYDMVTNGTLLNDYMKLFISKHNFKIVFSIDGPSYIHDKLRINCPHSEVLNNFLSLKHIMTNNLEINCTYTAFHKNNIDYSDLVDYFNKFNVKYHISNVITDIDWLKTKSNDFASEHKKILSTYSTLLNGTTNGDITNYVSAIIDALVYHQYNKCFCNDVCNGLTFDCDGKIYPCNKLIGICEYPNLSFTNLNYKDNEKCNQCWAKGLCSLCTANLYLEPLNAPYLQPKCVHQELYAVALKTLVQYFYNDINHFQCIVDNYFTSVSDTRD